MITAILNLTGKQKGILAMIGMCFCLTLMFVCGLKAIDVDEATSPVALSYVRVIINLAVIVIYCKLCLPKVKLFGDRSNALWLRGLFGAGNYVLMFYAVKYAGLSTASFLNSGSSILIALLAVPILREKFDALSFAASIASLVGLYLVFNVNFDVNPMGTLMAAGSAICLAIAYLAMAKTARKNSAFSIIFYFCLCSVIVHVLLHVTIGVTFPSAMKAWGYILIGSIAGIFSQFLLTYAFAKGSAQVNAALYFLAPAFNLIASVAVFAYRPSMTTMIGGMLIISFGAIVSYRRFSQKSDDIVTEDRIEIIIVKPIAVRNQPASLMPQRISTRN